MIKTYFKYFWHYYEIVFTRTLIDAIFIIGGAILRETLDLYIKKTPRVKL